jgi:hypothetical protein
VRGDHATLVDMQGQIVHRWQCSEGIQYPRLLENGNLLLHTRPPKDAGGAEKIGGSAAALLELDWDGNIVWEYRNNMMHHDFVRLPNGNHLLLFTEALPEGMTEKVKGGHHHEEDPERMWADTFCEVDPSGKVLSEWRSWEHLDFDEDVICPLETRKEWLHTNSIGLTTEGDVLLSFRGTSTIGIVDRKSGCLKWKWGKDRLSHQHNPTYLDTGRVLVFDNGAHRKRGPSHTEIIEVDPQTNEVTWAYKGDPVVAFFSFAISGADRLPNGNTLICEGVHGRVFEVTSEGETVWEYNSPFFYASRFGTTSSSFRSHRYALDFPGLAGKHLDPARYAELNHRINTSNEWILVQMPESPGNDKTEEGEKKPEAAPRIAGAGRGIITLPEPKNDESKQE